MKKFFFTVLFACSFLLCVLTGAGCGEAKVDIDKAEVSLRQKGYDVKVIYDEEFLDVEGIIEKGIYASRGKYTDERVEIDIIVFKDKEMAELWFNAEKASIENKLDTAEKELAMTEKLIEKYGDEMEDYILSHYEKEIEDYKQWIATYKEELSCMGINDNYVWIASDIAVMDDIK